MFNCFHPWFNQKTTDQLRYRAGVCCSLAEIDAVGLENGRRLPDSEWSKLEQAYLCYRSAYNHLAGLAIAAGKPRWHVRPKCHCLEHAVLDFNGKNLRYMANFLDEDMIRRVKKIAVSCHPRHVAKHVCLKYAISATLRWSGMIR